MLERGKEGGAWMTMSFSYQSSLPDKNSNGTWGQKHRGSLSHDMEPIMFGSYVISAFKYPTLV